MKLVCILKNTTEKLKNTTENQELLEAINTFEPLPAFLWCYLIGDYIDENIRPIKIKKHGRRAISVFKYGLDNLSNILLSGINRLNINYLQFLSCT